MRYYYERARVVRFYGFNSCQYLTLEIFLCGNAKNCFLILWVWKTSINLCFILLPSPLLSPLSPFSSPPSSLSPSPPLSLVSPFSPLSPFSLPLLSSPFSPLSAPSLSLPAFAFSCPLHLYLLYFSFISVSLCRRCCMETIRYLWFPFWPHSINGRRETSQCWHGRIREGEGHGTGTVHVKLCKQIIINDYIYI